jgi:hypothetical protein
VSSIQHCLDWKGLHFPSGLHSIHIPDSVEAIWELYFSNCYSLAAVTVDRHSQLRAAESTPLAGLPVTVGGWLLNQHCSSVLCEKVGSNAIGWSVSECNRDFSVQGSD